MRLVNVLANLQGSAIDKQQAGRAARCLSVPLYVCLSVCLSDVWGYVPDNIRTLKAFLKILKATTIYNNNIKENMKL
jgi:hypothetical protein